jgi:hypothetical protein
MNRALDKVLREPESERAAHLWTSGPHLVHIPSPNQGHGRETATNENLVWPAEKL